MNPATAELLADAVLVLHLGIVLFVVGGLVLIVLGNLRGWPFVNRAAFRALHLAAYTLFGLAVAAAWWRFPPARRR